MEIRRSFPRPGPPTAGHCDTKSNDDDNDDENDEDDRAPRYSSISRVAAGEPRTSTVHFQAHRQSDQSREYLEAVPNK
jgi:hypothetical protein